jgi:1-phosphofructokinase family hexose kinase
MILTVTLNPAVDLDLVINGLQPGGRYRAGISRRSPGGSGINISIIMNRLGHSSIATGFLAGFNGSFILDGLRREKVSSHFVYTKGETRINVCIIDVEKNLETRLHEQGIGVLDPDKAAFLRNYERILRRVESVCIGGSLPPGLNTSIYGPLIQSAKNNSITTILHPREEDLDAVLEEVPTFVKLDYQSVPSKTVPQKKLDAFMSRAQALHRRGTEWVLISLGKGNIIFSSRKGAWNAEGPNSEMTYLYATEDALLAGMIAAMREHASFEGIVRLATACHWECATHPEKFPQDRARVEELVPRILLTRID